MATIAATVRRALPESRNVLGAGFDLTSHEFQHLCELLQRNATCMPLKYGPHGVLHNHNAAHMTASFRLGAKAHFIDKILGEAGEPIQADHTSGCSVVDSENWTKHLGGFGLLGMGLEPRYWRYRAFFASEVSRLGPKDAVRTYFPRLASGLAADFFHAVIELGYWAESGDASLCSSGLAWLAAGYVELPKSEEHSPMQCSPIAALREMSTDPFSSMPTFEIDNGNSGYCRDMETLIGDAGFREAVLRYDVNLPAGKASEYLREMCVAAALSFQAGGCTDFYTLHSVTGSRAIWAIFEAVQDWGSPDATFAVETTALGALWRAIIFTHAARNNPSVGAALLPVARESLEPPHSWETIAQWALATGNSHLVKLTFTCADFHDRAEGDFRTLYHLIADETMRAREGGAKLRGVGVGSLLGEFAERLEMSGQAQL